MFILIIISVVDLAVLAKVRNKNLKYDCQKILVENQDKKKLVQKNYKNQVIKGQKMAKSKK